jgi:hypothetical protein
MSTTPTAVDDDSPALRSMRDEILGLDTTEMTAKSSEFLL